MTTSQKLHLERIGDLADAIFMVAKNANTTEFVENARMEGAC